MLRPLTLPVVILAAVALAGCGGGGGGGGDGGGGADETAQMERTLASESGGTAECVRLDDGDRYKCIVRSDAGEQVVDVDCGDADCIYNARP